MTLPDVFAKRLAALELVLTPAGCETCRRWSDTVFSFDDPDTGEVVPDRPPRCPTCGRVVPIVQVVHIVGIGPGDL
jgi:hypothetical protein